jgi:hypothetical protein
MSQTHPTFGTRLQRIARAVNLAAVNVCLAIGAAAAQAQSEGRPHPEGFGPPPPATPVPSSLLLVLAGFAVLLGWRWWRSRARAH